MRLSALALFALACRTADKGALDEAGLSDDTADADADGYDTEEDCDDADGAIHPGAAEICDGIDNDCDGVADEEVTDAFYADEDGDGFGDTATSVQSCEAPAGYAAVGGDCDDADAESYPGAPERCDGADNDCDGTVDEDVATAWYADADADGYGDPGAAAESCDPGEGYVAGNSDCDDTNPAANPAAAEVCDEADNDCDGETDEGVTDTSYADEDGDGFGDDGSPAQSCDPLTGYAAAGGDCDDGDPGINPAAAEVCDSLDNDCDALVDEAGAEGEATFYADADADGYGDPAEVALSCDQPAGYTADDADCDDSEAAINPGAAEVCDEADNDCDGAVDEGVTPAWYADADADGYGDPAEVALSCDQPAGYTADDADCDDGDSGINPAAAEVCDEADNDCDGAVDDADASLDESTADAWYADADGDDYGDAASALLSCEPPAGYVPDAGDCDDADPAVSPGAPERCNWADDDCDGAADEGLDDLDGSGTDDCKEVAVILSYGFASASGSYTCEGQSMLDREAQAIGDALADLGLSPVFFTDDKSESLGWADVQPYPVVVYHNGGWSAVGSASAVSAVEAAAAAGQGLLFWGDDVLKHASAVQGAYGTAALFDLAYLTGYTSNGIIGVGAVVSDSAHPVMDGVAGAVASFAFATDIDQGSPAGAGESVLMTLDGYPANPVVLAAEDGGQRTVTAMVSVYNSSACPGSDAAGLAALEALFQNAVWWAGGW